MKRENDFSNVSPYEVYTGEEQSEGSSALSACLILFLLVLLMILGTVFFYLLLRSDEPSETIIITSTPVQIVVVETETPIPPSRTPTPTPTPTPLIVPSPTLTAAPTITATNAPPVVQEQDCLLSDVGLPPLIQFVEIQRGRTRTEATLLFDQEQGANYSEITLIIAADGADAALTTIQPRMFGGVIPAGVSISLNDETRAFSNANMDAFDLLYNDLRGLVDTVEEFSITWFDTRRQPAMEIVIVGEHPVNGGILFEALWALNNSDTLTRSGAYYLCG